MALSVVLCPKSYFENRVKFQDGVRNRGQNGGKKSKIFYKPSLGFHTIIDSIPQIKKHRKSNLNPIATLKCSLLSFSRFRTLRSSHSWNCPPCFFGDYTPTSTVTSSSDSYSWYTSTAQSGPLLLMQHSHPTLTFKPLILFAFTLYLLPVYPHHHLMLLAISLYLLLSLPFPNSPRVLQWNAGGLKPGALNCYILFRLIPLTLFISRNLTLIYLSLSGSLDSLLCEQRISLPTASTPDLVFFLLMSPTLAAASSFSSERAYSSLSFLSPLFLRLAPTLIM